MKGHSCLQRRKTDHGIYSQLFQASILILSLLKTSSCLHFTSYLPIFASREPSKSSLAKMMTGTSCWVSMFTAVTGVRQSENEGRQRWRPVSWGFNTLCVSEETSEKKKL